MPSSRAALAPALAALAAIPLSAGAGTMGPLIPDTTILDVPGGGGCINAPGDSNAVCADIGVYPNASACADACAAISYCSGLTFHGPSTGAWAGHCVIRKDGVFNPAACGNGCDHTSANKTSGWAPYTVPWIPATKGFTSRIKPFWFGANSSGLDNDDTLALLAAHAVAGYGWQTGHPGGGSVGMGEAWQSQATTHLLDYLMSPSGGQGNANQTVIFQYRQIQVALRLFAECAIAADTPANDGFFLHDHTTGNICLAGQPWGTSDPYWTWTNSSAVDYWISSVVGELTSDASLTSGYGAVFFDECDQGQCGYRSGSCDFSQFNATQEQMASNSMYGKMVRALNAAGIVPILSLDNRMAASGPNPPCAVPEDALVQELQGTTWVRFYETWPSTFWAPTGPATDAAMISNAILEAEAGIPNVLHTGGGCPAPPRNITRPGRLGGDIEFAVASYLIVQSPGTTLSISNDWYDQSFCWRPDFDVDFGTPLAPPTRLGTYSWTRNYTRANVFVDVSSGRNGEVMLLA